MIDLRQNVIAITNANSNSLFSGSALTSTSTIPSNNVSSQNDKKLIYLYESAYKSICDKIKLVLSNLQAFIATDISFSAKVYFNEPFCKDYVRERLLVAFLKYMANELRDYADGSKEAAPFGMILVLSKLCLEFESGSIDYLVIFFIT